MKKLLIALIFIVFSSHAQLLFQVNDDTLLCYTYADGDEFNQSQLDEQRWTNGLDWTRVLISQDLAFNPNNVILHDGIVKFIANKKDSIYALGAWEIDSNYLRRKRLSLTDNKFHTLYSAGCIISKQKYHYGLYEIKFKVEEGRGIWPAFWFFGGNKNEEIDIFELKCEHNDEIHVDTHCPYGCDRGYKNKMGFKTNWGGWMPLSAFLHEGYNTMQLEWAKDELIWYINGYPLAYFKGDFPNPMNLYLNTSVAKDGGAFKPGPDKNTVFPNIYSIDYFRAWNLTNQVILKENKNMALSEPFEIGKMVMPIKNRGLMYNKKQFKSRQGFIVMNFSGDKITLTAFGELREKKASIVLKSLDSKQMWAFQNFETILTDINIDTLCELELIIEIDKKQYTKKIKLIR